MERDGETLRRYLLLTGARTWWDYSLLAAELGGEFSPSTVLVHGACPASPDEVGAAIWRAWGGREIPMPAAWSGPCGPTCPPGHRRRRAPGRGTGDFCPAAGMARNAAMIARLVDLRATGHQVAVLAFLTPDSRGAAHTAGLAREAALPLRTFRSPSTRLHPSEQLEFPAP